MHRKLPVAISIFFTTLLFWKLYHSDILIDFLEAKQDEIDLKTRELRPDKLKIFEDWHGCITKMTNIIDSEEFWMKFTMLSAECDATAGVEKLGIVTLRNSDEKKRVILPKNVSGTHNLITVGIGRDIRAEKQLRRKMLKLGATVDFYGADPVPYVNEDLYQQIGTFFPFAIGAQSGISNARVMKKWGYEEHNEVHIGIVYFLKNILKITKVDHLWFDAEGEEFGGILEFINGEFDKEDISVCQINIEVLILNLIQTQ